MNIPIYRAKKIDSDEYVIGFYSSAYDIHHYIITHLGVDTKANLVYQMSTDIHKIDPSTLAINFPDMLDSQGNKIFASLSEDGKGGNKMLKGVDMEQYGLKNTYYTAICIKGSVLLNELSESTSISFTAHGFLTELKVIGVQE